MSDETQDAESQVAAEAAASHARVRVRRHFGRARKTEPHPMTATEAERARQMGEATNRSERVAARKFLAPGSRPTPAGEQPTEAFQAAALEGSTTPMVAASRQIPEADEQWQELLANGRIIAPPYNPWILACTVEESSDLPGLIDAVAVNLTGYGYHLAELFPTTDEETGSKLDPPAEAAAEREQVQVFAEACNVELGLLGVFELADRDLEHMGNAYLEVLRDQTGEIAALEHLRGYTMRLGQLSGLVLAEFPIRNPVSGELEVHKRHRRFRTFVQVRGQRTTYFKQLGDPRVINWQTGEYKPAGETWGKDKQGNHLDGTEVVHVRQYAVHSDYGVPRWVGASPHVRAGRLAAELLVSWFTDAPIGAKLAMVAGGTFDQASLDEALDTIDDMARGHENAWTLITLEAEGVVSDPIDGVEGAAPRLLVEDLAYTVPPELYHGDDSLMETSSRRVRRMFRLPPLYTGDSDDYSKAAAQTSRTYAEEQVFVPLRRARWGRLMNRQILPRMGVNFWRFELLGPKTGDDDAAFRGLGPFVDSGGVTANMARQAFADLTGMDVAREPEAWANKPFPLVLFLLKEGMDPNLSMKEIVAELEKKKTEAAAAAAEQLKDLDKAGPNDPPEQLARKVDAVKREIAGAAHLVALLDAVTSVAAEHGDDWLDPRE